LLVERPSAGVLALWLDRPEKRNALDGALTQALLAALPGAGEARALLLGSSDPAAFCAGADLTMPDAERSEVSDLLYELHGRVARLPIPVVAVVEGAAVGGGAQLALASDLRVGGPSARFRFPGPGHGLAVGAWGLPAVVGRSRAIDLCLTMRTVDADEAMRIGLLDRLSDEPRVEAMALAEQLATLAPAAVARVKAVVDRATGAGAALALEREGNRPWSGSIEGLGRGA
jgi:enoyl-CoA hydratase/carnithine racemase